MIVTSVGMNNNSQPNDVKKSHRSYGKLCNKIVKIYENVVKSIITVNSAAKGVFGSSLYFLDKLGSLTQKHVTVLDKVKLGFIVIGGSLRVFASPAHIYFLAKNGVDVVRNLIKKDAGEAFSSGMKAILSAADLANDAASVGTILAALGVVANSAISWVGPLVLVTGVMRSLELGIYGVDFYKVTKFKKRMLESSDYQGTLAFLNNKDNEKIIKKTFGVSQKQLVEALSTKTGEDEQAVALKKLKGRITSSQWSIGVNMAASAVSTVASLVFVAAFLAPIVFPPAITAVPIIMGVATGIMFLGSGISFCNYVADFVVDIKFKKALGMKLI